MHRLGRQRHFLAFAHEVVGTVAANLARGVFGWHLLDVTHETGKYLTNQRFGNVLSRIGSVHLVLHVVTGRGGSQLQGGGVLLVVQLQAFYFLGLLARTEYQDTCRQGVQRTGMAYLYPAHTYLSRYAGAHKGQGTKRCHAVGLVDIYVFACCEIHTYSEQNMVMTPTMAQ